MIANTLNYKNIITRKALLLAAVTSILLLVGFTSVASVQVTIANGTLAGTKNAETGVHSFKGIPYAAPPVGELRWRAPQPSIPWKGVRDATQFGNQCMQKRIFDDMLFRSSGTSEDCLFLNVWTPAAKSDKKLPVLLYFYGGGFVAGDGSEPRYDGEQMARNDIVVVTINYRLGLFGLMAHPELSKEADYSGSGNYTFMDQIAALHWIIENIAAFGGDPQKVTIGGESAGSLSVSILMASPLSRDNFQGAIGQSGSILGPTLRTVSLSDAELTGSRLADALVGSEPGALQSLRKMSAEELLTKAGEAGFNWFNPSIDGHVLPTAPADIYAQNRQAQIPLLAGVNSQEASYRDILGNAEISLASYKQALKRVYPDDAEKVFTLYPASTKTQILDAAQALAGDRWLAYSTWNWIDLSTRKSNQPGYYYYYDQIRPAPVGAQYDPDNRPRGAVHSAEIEYALGNLQTHPAYQWQDADIKVSALMHQYFANFVKTGTPNAEGLPKWPMFSDNQQIILRPQPVTEEIQYLRDRNQFHRDYFKKPVQQ